jgi:hypothetical protein
MSARINLTGRTFSRLTVLEYSHKDSHNHTFWNCQCICGEVVLARSAQLISRRKQSCGCLQKEVVSAMKTTHGLSDSTEWVAWSNMLQRCNNPSHPGYSNYGGRGIKVCERWHKFENFIADMGRKHTCDLTLERENNDGNYEPDNCSWKSYIYQNANQQRSLPCKI